MPFSKFSRPFYFVRHGITEANINQLWCGGGWDIDLSERGQLQAQKAAEVLHTLTPAIDMIFTSPMKRSQQTTQHLNAILKKPVTVIEDLREWKVGEWEGMPWDGTGDFHIDPPGGETVAQFQSRVQAAILHCLSQANHPLISSHGAVGKILLKLFEIPDQHIENCKVHKISLVATNNSTKWKLEF